MRSLYFLLTFFFLTPSLVVAKDYNETNDIAQLFENYMAKYNHYISSGEFHIEPKLYHPQIMVYSNSRAPRVVSDTVLYNQVKVFLDSLINDGVTLVKWQQLDIQLLNSNMALASNVAIRYNSNGEAISTVGASYNLYKQKEGWRITAFSVYPVENAYHFKNNMETKHGQLGRLSPHPGSTTE